MEIRDLLEASDTANEDGAKRAALEAFRRERERQRRNDPLPAGGLFDDVARNTQELF
jgi:hypothetical protein